jgi:hypothetical protein
MQGINVFANATARNAAITSPQEGQFAFTKDNNSLWYYDGAAWVASGATGDIEGVTAGVGISGGGTSGTVTITNSMATEITASGDIIVGTGSGTFDNLPIGTTGQVLTADTTVSPYKVKWATASSGLPSWTTYTPSLSGSITIGNGTLTGRYMESNTTVIAEVTILFGSTTTINSTVFIGLPSSASSGSQIHNLHLRDEGTATYTGHAIVSGSSVVCYIDGASGTYVSSVGINSTTPFTWTTTDFIKLNITYEKA